MRYECPVVYSRISNALSRTHRAYTLHTHTAHIRPRAKASTSSSLSSSWSSLSLSPPPSHTILTHTHTTYHHRNHYQPNWYFSSATEARDRHTSIYSYQPYSPLLLFPNITLSLSPSVGALVSFHLSIYNIFKIENKFNFWLCHTAVMVIILVQCAWTTEIIRTHREEKTQFNVFIIKEFLYCCC